MNRGPRVRKSGKEMMLDMQKQKGTLRRVMKIVMSKYAVQFIIVILCIGIATYCTLQGTLFMQQLIDAYIMPMLSKQIDTNTGFSALASALTRLAVILAIGIAASYTYNRIMIYVSQGSLLDIRKQIFTTMEKLPISYFDTHAHGDIMSVYTNDVDTLRQLIGQSIPSFVDSLITVVMTFVSMIMLSWQMTILSIVLMSLTLVASAKLAGRAGKFFGQQQKNLGAVNGYIEEMMEGQKVVKVFCHEEKSFTAFSGLNETLRSAASQANSFTNIIGPVNNNLGHLSYVVCAVIGALFAINGVTALSLGTLVTFLTLNRNFSRPISQISQQMNSIVMAMAGAGRIFALMDEAPEKDDGYVELVDAKIGADGNITESETRTGIWAWRHPHQEDGSVTYRRLAGGVTFDHVDFGYVPDKTVLHDITMYAQPGQKIAFVGGTGAGKTTITNLINRFYDIQDGKIRYDEININKIRKSDLRRSLGMVLQDTNLFTGTVMENIRYGRLDATDAQCINAARLANADGFIRRLPDGYQTMLTLMKGRTTFVIAHRLSTVRNADCIMVLEQGRIIERGTHDQLIEAKGKYYQLYTGNAIQES